MMIGLLFLPAWCVECLSGPRDRAVGGVMSEVAIRLYICKCGSPRREKMNLPHAKCLAQHPDNTGQGTGAHWH